MYVYIHGHRVTAHMELSRELQHSGHGLQRARIGRKKCNTNFFLNYEKSIFVFQGLIPIT